MNWITGNGGGGANKGSNNTLNDAGSSTEQEPSSVFKSVDTAPLDPVFAITNAYKADPNPRKVNMGVGAYRNDNGEPFLLNIVKKVEKELIPEMENTNDAGAGQGGCMDGLRNMLMGITNTGRKANKEYSQIDGNPELKDLTQKLIFGKASKRVASCQCLSGTGALRIVSEFVYKNLRDQIPYGKIYYSDQTWGNHPAIFRSAGLTPEAYPYWDPVTKGIKFREWMEHMSYARPGSLYLIHPVAHNPTGVDPSDDQWAELLEMVKRKKHLVLMDSAYQGYASGDLVRDRKSIEMFFNAGLEFFVCQSFAKNMGLYGERIGMLHVVCQSEERAAAVSSQVKMCVRPMYSSPPIHGALIVQKILSNPEYYNEWVAELKDMADRILDMRRKLKAGLVRRKTPGNWDHITSQIGMFSFTGLTPEQCEQLTKKYSIYLLKSGRISIAGMNNANVDYVAEAIHNVVSDSANTHQGTAKGD